MLLKYRYLIVFTFFYIILANWCLAQSDSVIYHQPDNRLPGLRADSVVRDSSQVADTLPTDSPKEMLDDIVEYHSEDSIIVSISDGKIYLYNESQINYTDIELHSDFIEFDMNKSEVFATGMPDSAGIIKGTPVFNQGKEQFESKELRYNFDSKKGMIYQIVTEEGEGYLHSEKTKRHTSGQIHVHNGKYTTCDAEHPHFYVALNKAIAIPNDKVISKSAYLVLADIPLYPLFLPFGWFPNTPDATSGLLFPSFGYEDRRGYYLKDLGWYIPVNEHFDMKLYTDIFSRGSWAAKMQSNYALRYKFTGNLNVNYHKDKFDNNFIPTDNYRNDWNLNWRHDQSAQANPNQRFSANVRLQSTGYNKNQTTDYTSYTQNTQNSSVSYSRNRQGGLFNFSAKLNHSQNMQTGKVSATLPNMSFGLKSPLQPFRDKLNPKGTWYENIKIGYSAKFENEVETYDSIFYSKKIVDNFFYGYEHNIPLSTNIQLLKLININPSVNYRGVISPTRIKYNNYALNDSLRGIDIDTLNRFTYGHNINGGVSLSVNRKIFGMYHNTRPNANVIAVRHVITPSVSYNYKPDIGKFIRYNYIKHYYDEDTTLQQYSSLESSRYSLRVVDVRETSNINFSLKNNLEMKLRDDTDTSKSTKKVSLIDNFDFNGAYNFQADSLKLSVINFRASTKVVKKLVSLKVAASFDPYDYNKSTLRRVNQFVLNNRSSLARLTRATISTDMRLDAKTFSDFKNNDQENNERLIADYSYMRYLYPGLYIPGTYVDFQIPWNLNFSYSWNYTKNYDKRNLRQTMTFGGGFSLTEKWKFSTRSGYDLDAKKLSFTTVDVSRNLHCWDMTLRVIPFGRAKSYHFTIRANASILKDLKYEKRKDSRYDTF